MKLSFVTAGLFLIFINDSEQQKQTAYDALKQVLSEGVSKELQKIVNEGQTFTLEEAAEKRQDALLKALIDNVTHFESLVKENRDIQQPEKMLEKLIDDVYTSKEVKEAFSSIIKEGLAPRVIGAGIMGSTQLATDFMLMLLARY